MYFSMLNDAPIGILWFMPFFQSVTSDDFSTLSSFVSMELVRFPVYEMYNFSYHLSFPILFFLLKGYILFIVNVTSGSVSDSVESDVLWLASNDVDIAKGVLGNVCEYEIDEDFVFCVSCDGL